MRSEPPERFWDIFFQVYEPLPRQGPGSRASAARALALCANLPPTPDILDIGCGAGGQTLHLAELTADSIVAVDSHAPLIERFRLAVEKLGLTDRIRPRVGDMAAPDHPPGSFDLLWSEGALYNIGVGEALRLYRDALRSGGYFVFTEAVWRKENPPPEVLDLFADYPAMGWARETAALIEANGYRLLDHFTLPDEDWWTDFYTPMESRIDALRRRFAGDAEAQEMLTEIAREPALHRRYSSYYGYEFFVAKKG